MMGSLSLLLPGQALADAPPGEPISLHGAIEQALRNNRTLLSADIDIDIADANLLSAQGVGDLEVDGNMSFQDLRTTAVAGNPFSQTGSDNVHIDGSINKSLDYGGRFGVKIGGDYIRTTSHVDLGDGSPFDLTSTTWNPTVAITYAQSLLRNSGETAFLAAQHRAEASREVSVLERENVAANAIRDVVVAYWELAYAAKDLAIRKESLELAREQLRITQARLDVGVGAPTDVAAVQQTISTRTEDVIIAEQTLASRALDVRLLLGTELKPGLLGLNAVDELNAQPRDYSLTAETDSAILHNPQIAEARARGRLAQVDVDVTENGLLPQLDLTASLGPLGNAAGAGDAFKQLVEFDNFQIQAGLKLTMPVENRNAKGQRAAAQHTLHKVRVTEDDLRAQIVIGVQRNYDTVHAAQQRLTVDTEAIKFAKVNLDAEHARFDVGRSTNFDVLRRQDELAQSELRQARAAADYLKSVAVLQALTGELLPTYGVTLRPRQGHEGDEYPSSVTGGPTAPSSAPGPSSN
jgi:outer membrane protein TolC